MDTLTKLVGSMAVPPGDLLDGIYWAPAVAPEPVGSFAFGSQSRLRTWPYSEGGRPGSS